jgi:hypothetical protein
MGAEKLPLQTADVGYGPLLQRDYWAVIRDCRLRPTRIMALVASRFAEFAPEEICRFARRPGARGPLARSEELAIHIRGAGFCAVRVLHLDASSLTLATLPGHPEAGRITFGAYRNDRGEAVFHIRSRARASTARNYVGFLVVGEAMQTDTWVEFVNRVAATVGSGVRDVIHAETRALDERETAEDDANPTEPTYRAAGD